MTRRPRPTPAPAPAVGRRGITTPASPHTTALLGVGHVGTRYATDLVLQFQAELAVAHEAVATELSTGWAASHGLLAVQSRARDHREFLLRPDRGRRLDEPSRERLIAQATHGVDVQLIVADGLSAVACMDSGLELLAQLTAACRDRGWTVGTPVGATFARVWLEDEIGELVGARVAAILLGERPGLGTGDGMSAYLVYEPRVGRTDADRNMMSNIHRRGTPPDEAAQRLADLIAAMLAQGTSGVGLDLGAVGQVSSYRAPQSRQRLVDVDPEPDPET
jgi:ethanolamine ammonia-lyase small subunit